MSISEKVYRFLIRAYSREHRSRYAEPMAQLFRDQLRRVHGTAEWMALWRRTLADWMVSVPSSYWPEAWTIPSFDGWGDPARRCIFFARCEAGSFSRHEVTVEHLLLGVLRQQPALVPGYALETLVRRIEEEEPAGRRDPLRLEPHAQRSKIVSRMGSVELSEAAVRVVTTATKMAQGVSRAEVSPGDLARAILREPESLAGRLLREHMSERD